MKEFKIKHQAIAGTLESSDIQIILDKSENQGIEIELQSSVINQYGRRIREVIVETLQKMNVDSVKLSVVDKGALDCTIIARTIAAVHRAADAQSDFDWEEIEQWNV